MAKKKNAASAAAVAAIPVEGNTAENNSVAATAGDATLDNRSSAAASRNHHNNRNNGDEEEEEEIELLQVDLGDMVKLKQVLDESVVIAILEHLPEDFAWDNVKLGIMFAACVFAMFAQFAPLPFPESRPIIGACGMLYFILSGVLQLIATFVDGDTILWTCPLTAANRKEGAPVPKNKDLEQYGVRVRSGLPRFSEWFTVTLELAVPKDGKTNKNSAEPPFVSQTWSIGHFFDKEGYFDEIGLGMEVDKLFERFNLGKYDVASSDNKSKKE